MRWRGRKRVCRGDREEEEEEEEGEREERTRVTGQRTF